MDYKNKYIKYKKKYTDLKKQMLITTQKCNDFIKSQLKKNLNVYSLNIDDSWKFKDNFPHNLHKNTPQEKHLQEKIWYIKKETRVKTNYKDRGEKLTSYNLPKDLCICKSVLNESELNNLWNQFDKLFKNYRNLNIINSYQPKRGLTYLFTADEGAVQYSDKTLNFLNNYNKELYNLINKVVDHLMRLFCINTTDKISKEYFLRKMQIVFLKYETNDGIWLHIDNIARYDQGPIVTMSVGPEKIYYDLTPTLIYDRKDLQPIRVEVDNGEFIIMDGSSRMEWAHGLPFDVPFSKTKYSILLKFDKFFEHNIIYNKTLDTFITSSVVLCDNHCAKK
ncbi:hypothetical protein EON71_01105 [bacterium]|nr:MAG: hypothetical protein EON71_01105 [bacterium]